MLTSVYYYGYYKPYILNSVPKIGKVERRPPTEPEADPAKKEKYILNNALKRDIIRYAGNLSGTVNDLRESSRDVLQDIFNFKRNVMEHNLDFAKERLSEDLDTFTKAYNRNLTFDHKDGNSRPLKHFVNDLAYDISISTTALSKLGVKVTDDETMVFDPERIKHMKGRDIAEANRQNHALFKNIYDSTGEFLTLPLSEHLKFKNLGYYYNYKLGTMEKDGFKLIQSGMIVDRIV